VALMGHPYWPLFDLRVRTPRLELRYPNDDDVTALSALAARGIHPPDYMPFSSPWSAEPPGQLEPNSLRYHWRVRAETTPEKWDIPMATVFDGEIVGAQGIHAVNFPVSRTFSTGSWLGQAHQGKGIGKEMRAAILHLGFDGLGAQRAESGAKDDNVSSIGVSRALGYDDNGDEVFVVGGEAQREVRFVMSRAQWEQRRRDDIVIEGLAPCLAFLGLAGGSPPPAPPQ
jgi:RimJ/RimL family protein N-acetyltransferase